MKMFNETSDYQEVAELANSFCGNCRLSEKRSSPQQMPKHICNLILTLSWLSTIILQRLHVRIKNTMTFPLAEIAQVRLIYYYTVTILINQSGYSMETM